MPDTSDVVIRIRASIADVFAVLSDPVELAHATRNRLPQDVSKMPPTTGTTWWYRAGPWGKIHMEVTHFEPPYRTARRLTGAAKAAADYHLEAEGPHTTVVHASFHVDRPPMFVSASRYLQGLRSGLEAVRKYVEQAAESIGSEVSSSWSVEDSEIRAGRKQLTVTLTAAAKVPAATCYDVTVCDTGRFWEWMVDRSRPDTEIHVSDDWPDPGSFYTYKARSNLSWLRWEHGTVSVVESAPPGHVLLREEQDNLFARVVFLTDWSFVDTSEGTHITSRYRITPLGRLVNRVITHNPEAIVESLRKQLENVVIAARTRVEA